MLQAAGALDRGPDAAGGLAVAHFYGSITGKARTSASRCGSRDGGIDGHVRGWNSGVRVSGCHEDGADVFHVYATRGSNGGTGSGFKLGVVREEGGSVTFEPAPHITRDVLLSAGVQALPGARYTLDSREVPAA
jgi:hypothetical protein